MKLPIALLLGAVSLGSTAAEPADSTTTDSTKTFIFTDVISLPTTSVKDQNKSGTCWCFAGTSFYENEIRKNGGDSLDLSEMFTVRQCYRDKAERYVRMYGQTNFGAGGSIMDLPYVWKRYGAVPETFEYKGKTYTPKSYAESLPLKVDDYVPVTSFSHHPYYETFAVEVPDNWLWAQYYNVPLDELKAIIDNSLAKGHTLVWAADVSEGGFKWTKGVAPMPKGKNEGDMDGTELSRWVKLSDKERVNDKYNFEGPVAEIEVTPELRQKMFDSQETTDDHGMEIVGTAVDQFGNKYYKVKNSWDTNQVYDGFFYVSEPYLLAKTMDILVHRDAIPKSTAKKLGL